jgi:hypothetical protein
MERAYAVDNYLRLLEDREFKFVPGALTPDELAQDPDCFVFRDRNGQTYRIDLRQDERGYLLKSISQLAAATGIDTISSLPTFVDINQAALIPLLSPKLRSILDAHRKVFTKKHPVYVSAFASPTTTRLNDQDIVVDFRIEDSRSNELRDLTGAGLSSETKVDALVQSASILVFESVFGLKAVNRLSIEESIFAQFIHSDHPFIADSPECRSLLREKFATRFDWRSLQQLSAVEAKVFYQKMNDYLNQLVSLESESIKRAFRNIEQFDVVRLVERRKAPSYPTQITHRLRTIFEDFSWLMNQRFRGHFLKLKAEKYDRLDRRGYVAIPERRIDGDVFKNKKWRGSERLILFDYLMYAHKSPHGELLGQWRQDLNGEDPLKFLLQSAAKWDSTTALNGLVHMRHFDDVVSVSKQLHIDPKSPPSLILIAINDRESQVIYESALEIAKVADLKIMRVDNAKRPFKLDLKLAAKVASLAQGRRIILCEVSDMTPRIFKTLKSFGSKLKILDHHSFEKDRWRWRSTAEQFWDLYSYKPSAKQLFVAIKDRSDIFELMNVLNLNDSDRVERLNQYFSGGSESHIHQPGIFDSRFRIDPESNMYVGDDLGGIKRLGINAILRQRHYPNPYQFFGIDGNVLNFVGSPEVAWEVIDYIKTFPDVKDQAHWYGDQNSMMTIWWRLDPLTSGDDVVRKIKSIAVAKKDELVSFNQFPTAPSCEGAHSNAP